MEEKEQKIMKTRTAIWIAALVLSVATLAASAAFTPPTDEQLNEAAAAPGAALAALLQDAGPDQAAAVVKSVVEKIIALNLSEEELTARLADVIRIAYKSLPPQEFDVFAAALGRTLAGNPAVAGLALAAIRNAMAGEGGTTATATFDQSFLPGGGTPSPVLHPQPPDVEPVVEARTPPPEPRGRAPTPPSPEPTPPPTSPDYPGQTIP